MSEVLIIPNVNIVMINVCVHIYLFNVLGCVYIIYMMVVVSLHVVLIYNFLIKCCLNTRVCVNFAIYHSAMSSIFD